MNGLFAWALREIGFKVTMLGSTVGAPAQGTAGDSDHLLLQVDLAEPWLVDVGFGNGIIEPLPLRFGSYRQGRWEFRLAEDDDKWFFHNHPFGGPGYGFTLLPRTYASFAARCHELQTSPESGFVRTTVCHRFTAEGFASLRGAVLKQYHRDGATTEELSSEAHYAAVLDRIFGLDQALAAQLWEAVWQRHLQWRATEAQQ
jgi:N-hydroxyarylamine O-acetyltransferase